MSTTGVYKIKCLANGKIYIGSSFNIQKIIKTHFNRLKKNNHNNPHLQSAYNTYGEALFMWDVVEQCNVENLLNKEQYWMDLTKCYDRKIGFNNCLKADRPTGYKHTISAKNKMSQSKLGKKLSKEHISNIIKSRKGWSPSIETKLKISKANKGKNNGMYGRKEDEEHKRNRMKNLLSTPKWNKGLTADKDNRIKKLAFWENKTPPNALKCRLIHIKTKQEWTSDSLKRLSETSPISLSTINRIKRNKAGYKIKSEYKLEIL